MPASTETAEHGLYKKPVYRVSREDSEHPVILVCEHASSYIPTELNALGLSDEAAKEHIAWDIGALKLAERLSKALGATLISAAYSRLLIKTCHKRGAFAMGGMAAFIPSKDAERNNQVLNKVKADKELEARNGHDGTWIAHPGLADTAMEVFNRVLGDNKNQLFVTREDDAPIAEEQLLAPCAGERTEEGMRANIRVAVQYIEAWISGNGCVPIYGLMEDAATAEISRTSIWQWIHHQKTLSNGKPVTKTLFRQMLAEEMRVIQDELGEHRFSSGRFDDAARLMEQITTSDDLIDFLTLPGYRFLA
jgi:malate synthase